jgi:hypothetical protein
MKILVLMLCLVAGCGVAPLIELQSKEARVWLVSRDGKEVWRCYDTAGAGDPPPRMRAVCVEAERK